MIHDHCAPPTHAAPPSAPDLLRIAPRPRVLPACGADPVAMPCTSRGLAARSCLRRAARVGSEQPALWQVLVAVQLGQAEVGSRASRAHLFTVGPRPPGRGSRLAAAGSLPMSHCQ